MKQEILFYARRLHALGFFPGTGGNITVRLNDNSILVTPSSRPKDTLLEEDFVRVDLRGNILEGALKPSSELKMHLYAYSVREDVNAAIHAHPAYSVAASVCGGVDSSLLAESAIVLGRVPLADFAVPSTEEVPASLKPFIKDSDVFLLANHGPFCLGSNLFDAANKLETLESLCRISYIAGCFGKPKGISKEDLDKLLSVAGGRKRV